MADTGGVLGVNVTEDVNRIREHAIHQRVITAEPYSEGETPEAVMLMDVEEDSVSILDVVVQAAYMLPVIGNVMALGDVARDVADLTGKDPRGQPNHHSAWLWAVLVIDAIGLVPAAGNASRPMRLATRESVLAFSRGEGVEMAADILINMAAGEALSFLEQLPDWVESKKSVFQNEVINIIDQLGGFIEHPVDAATQAGMIERNPAWWDILDKGKKIVFVAFDRLLDALGADRLELVGSLRVLSGVAVNKIMEGIDELLPLVAELASEVGRRRRGTRGVNHEGSAITGQTNRHVLDAEYRQSSRHETDASPTPAGCACGFPVNRRNSGNPIDYVMGDENLWHTDFRVPGLIDIEWTRYYRSSIDELDDSELGARWSTPYHLRFEEHDGQLTYIDGLSRALPIESLAIGESRFLPREQFTLEHPDVDTYVLRFLDEGVEHYQRIAESGSQRVHFRLVERRERDGRALTLNYREGCLASITDNAALDLRFHYSDAGLLERIIRHYPGSDQAPEVLARYTHDAQRDLVTSEDARGYERHYQYQHHLVTRYTHRNELAVELEWDWPGKAEGALPSAHESRCIRNRLEDGSEDTRFEYHRGLWYTRVTDAADVVTIYRYNYHNLIESITHPYHPELGSEHWRWDEHGRLIRHMDGEGRTTRYRYDAEGRMTAVTDPQGLTTQIEYDDQGLPARVTNPDGRVRETRFDKRGLPVEEIAPSGRKTTYKHNEHGLLTAMTDAAGNTYRYEWNDQGLMVSASDCSQKTTEYHYDHRGHLCEMINAAGHPTRYRLDAGGLPLSIQHADGATETFTHDGEGSLTEYVDPAGQRTRYRYNGKGQPIERRDPLGQTFSYQYDRLLRLSALVNQNGDRWSFRYDGGGHLIEEQGFDGRRKTYQYDAAGALRELHEGDQVTTFKRDSMGRLLERRSERPGLLPVTTQFAYDPLGRLVRAASDDSETQFRFDTVDNLIAEVQRHRLPNGSEYSAVTRHTHDALGNRETTTLPDGQQIGWLRYGSGHVHAMALDQQELIGFERDDLHREVRRHQRGREVESRYDPVGRLIAQQLKPAHGQALRRQWHYAENGLLTAVDDSLRGTTQYGYDPLGRLRKAASPVREEHFDFDPAGNLVDPQDQRNSDSTSATRWRGERPSDHLDRGPDEHIRVDYPNAPKLSSAMGNLLKRYVGTHYHYDDFGNLVRRISPNGETWQYRYDPEHRLIEASHYAQAPAAGDAAMPTIQARYGYDGLGRRVWKQVEHQGQSPELTVFTWDGDLLQSEECFQGKPPTAFPAEPLELARENPERRLSVPVAQRVHSLDTVAMAPQRRVSYLFEPGSFIPAAKLEAHYEAIPQATGSGTVLYSDYRLAEPKLYYFQTDHLGTPLEVTDTNGDLAWVGHYSAWGKLDKARDGNGNNAATDNPFRFQGQYHDEETGLHYNRFRYYDPQIGRFTTQDPIGLAGGENLYMYAPNPTGWVDPLGLSSKRQCDCKTYQTYTKANNGTGQVYTGRTSGTGSPLDNVAARDSRHHMNEQGYGPAVLDRSSTNRDAIRGREQQLIDAYGGARSQGGSSGNAINGISSRNPRRNRYIDESNREFGND